VERLLEPYLPCPEHPISLALYVPQCLHKRAADMTQYCVTKNDKRIQKKIR
jgi:hypothetical protein